jgi:hypothetical protein
VACNSFAVGLDANRAHFKHTNNTYAGSSGPVDPFDPVPGSSPAMRRTCRATATVPSSTRCSWKTGWR